MKTLKKQIDEKKIEISSLEHQIRNCKHQWKPAIYNPETKKELVPTGRLEAHGSDVWDPGEWRDVTKDRWSRECSVCGHIEYTYERETVKVVTQPKF